MRINLPTVAVWTGPALVRITLMRIQCGRMQRALLRIIVRIVGLVWAGLKRQVLLIVLDKTNHNTVLKYTVGFSSLPISLIKNSYLFLLLHFFFKVLRPQYTLVDNNLRTDSDLSVIAT